MFSEINAKKYIRLLTVIMLFTVPLVFSTAFYDSFYIPKLIAFRFLLFLMIPAAAYLYIIEGRHRRLLNSLNLSILFYLVVCFISTINSEFFSVSMPLFFETLFYVAAFFIWLIAIRNQDMDICLKTSVIAGGISALYALLQHNGIDFPGIEWSHPEIVKSRSIGTFGNPTFLAGYLVMIIPLIYYYYIKGISRDPNITKEDIEDSRTVKNPAFLIIWIIVLLALILTYTRGAWVALVVSHIVFIVILNKKNIVCYQKPVKIFILAFLCVILLCFAIEHGRKKEVRLISRMASFRDRYAVNMDRIFLWKAGMKNFLDNVPFGTGLGSFTYVFSRYRYLEPSENRGRIAMPEACHNQLIEIASSSGIFGIISFGFILFFVFNYSVRLIKKSEGINRFKWICITSSLTAYVVHNFFLYSTIATEVLWWFIISLLVDGNFNNEELSAWNKKLSVFQKVVLSVAILISLFLSVLSIESVIGNCYLKMAKKYESSKEWEKSWNCYRNAIRCNPSNYKYYLYKGKMIESFFNEKPYEALPNEIIKAYSHAIELFPFDPYPWADIGRFYGHMAEKFDKNFFGKAVGAYEKAIMLDCYNPLFYNDLAVSYSRIGKPDEALKCYEKSIELNPGSFLVCYNMALCYWEKGDIDSARNYIEKAIRIEPDNVKAKKVLLMIKNGKAKK